MRVTILQDHLRHGGTERQSVLLGHSLARATRYASLTARGPEEDALTGLHRVAQAIARYLDRHADAVTTLRSTLCADIATWALGYSDPIRARVAARA